MQRKGRFELADGGSLFLDEIGDISLELQPKLLRAVQEQEFERLGSAKTINVNARIIAATHRNLSFMIGEGKFREDLFYRLNVFPIEIPPLRERRDDIPLLVNHFVRLFAARMKRSYESASSEAIAALCEYDWPGNIRELQNLIERAVILSPGSVLRVPLRDLRPRIIAMPRAEHDQTLEQVERAHILRTLSETKWTLSGPHGAATRLAMNRSTLQYRMKKLGIVRHSSFEEGTGAAVESGAGSEWQSSAS
jgi:formate hydrogenlyase transcriptional activator